MKYPLKSLVAYYTSWSIYSEKHYIKDIKCEGITHLNYAFANILNESIVVGDPHADININFNEERREHWRSDKLYGNFGELFNLKLRCPLIKTYISIGGWTWSKEFSAIAESPIKRAKFVKSCIDFVESYGFDGIDIDWEYPGGQGLPSNGAKIDDGSNYVLLLKEFKKQSNKIGLSIAVPCLPMIIDQFPLGEMYPLVDHFNIMCYDFGDPQKDSLGRLRSIPHSNLRGPFPSVEHGVQHIKRKMNVKGDKMVLGIPFYGKSFYDCEGGPGSWCHSDRAGGRQAGVWDFKHLPINGCIVSKNYLNGSFCKNSVSRRIIFWDSIEDIKDKIKYCEEEENISGIMWWESSQDKKENDSIQYLLSKHHNSATSSRNRLCYPNSPFTELRRRCQGAIHQKDNTSPPSPPSLPIDVVQFKADSFYVSEIEDEIFRDSKNWEYLLEPKSHYNHGKFIKFVSNNREIFPTSFIEKIEDFF